MANFKEFGVGRAVSPMGHDLETHRHIQQYGTEQKDLSFMEISICFVYGLAKNGIPASDARNFKQIQRRLHLDDHSTSNRARGERILQVLCHFEQQHFSTSAAAVSLLRDLEIDVFTYFAICFTQIWCSLSFSAHWASTARLMCRKSYFL